MYEDLKKEAAEAFEELLSQTHFRREASSSSAALPAKSGAAVSVRTAPTKWAPPWWKR